MSDSFLRGMIGATKLGLFDLDRVLRTAPRRYKSYEIDKKGGGKRRIAHPSKELKLLQWWFLDNYLQELPVHKAAAAYVPGRGILDNAMQHVGKRFLIKLDFEQFFPSLTVNDWDRYMSLKECRLKLDEHDRAAVRQILFWGDGSILPMKLSIGAPTSPTVSNILMTKFDKKVVKSIAHKNVIYTRYADDITISSDDLYELIGVEKQISSIVKRQQWPKLRLNADKRGLYAKGVRQLVTGLVLTPDRKVSVGRQRKRLIHAMLYRSTRGELSQEDRKKLQGFIGFCIANEPDFVKTLKKKYGVLQVRKAQTLR